MSWIFNIHYTRDEARALLPRVKEWLEELRGVKKSMETGDAALTKAIGLGDDLGGAMVNNQLKAMAQFKACLENFESRDIQLKDLDRGLLDFPGFVDGKEVFLCWEEGEDDVEFWHDLETGYAGRERI